MGQQIAIWVIILLPLVRLSITLTSVYYKQAKPDYPYKMDGSKKFAEYAGIIIVTLITYGCYLLAGVFTLIK